MPPTRNTMRRDSICFLCIQRSNINHYDTPEFFQRNWAEFRSQLHFARTSICTLVVVVVVVQIPESLRKSDLMSTCVLTFFSWKPSLLSFSFPLSPPRSDWSLFRCESNADWGYQCRASPNEITIIKRRSRNGVAPRRRGYLATVALPSHRGIPPESQMSYRVERRKSPANFSFGHSSIFHRVASLLPTPLHLSPFHQARSWR